MIPATFEYHAPSTVREAVTLLRKLGPDAKLLAGGHSLIPAMKLRLTQPKHLIDLGRISGLSYVREEGGNLAIGAMTTYYNIQSSPIVQRRLPALAEAIDQIADVQVRNKGTIGGSLAHADPAADLPALMLALEASLEATGAGRARTIPAERFFVDLFTTALRPTEVLTQVTIPLPPARTGVSYKKLPNKASHYALVGVAAVVTLAPDGTCQKVRMGVTGAGPKAVRAKAAERFLEGKQPTEANLRGAAERAARGIDFLSDIHGSSEYREAMTKVFALRALEEAVGRAGR